MMTCPICHTENHHLAVICSSCGGFLQYRADNLDLFTTAWGVIERPRRAFHFIATARHKNYTYILSAFAGIGMMFSIFWIMKAGNYSESLLNLLAAGLALGPFLGILSTLLYSIIVKLESKVLSLVLSFRNAFAVGAYSLVPIVLSVIFILPIELLTFGQYFFSSNPSPFVLRPVSYSVLLTLDALFACWSLALQFVGLRVLLRIRWTKVLLILVIGNGGIVASVWYLISKFAHVL